MKNKAKTIIILIITLILITLLYTTLNLGRHSAYIHFPPSRKCPFQEEVLKSKDKPTFAEMVSINIMIAEFDKKAMLKQHSVGYY